MHIACAVIVKSVVKAIKLACVVTYVSTESIGSVSFVSVIRVA